MAASNATLIITANNGRTLSIDAYVPDATATLVGFNPSGLASSASNTQLVVPADGVITDWVAVAAPTAVGLNIQLDSASVPGNTLRHANQLCTLPTRAKLRIPVKRGQILTALQF
jgi:hypothetical protein